MTGGQENTTVIECPEDPVKLLGQPIGMYHCPDCGCMVIAGLPHGPHDDGCLLGLEVWCVRCPNTVFYAEGAWHHSFPEEWADHEPIPGGSRPSDYGERSSK